MAEANRKMCATCEYGSERDDIHELLYDCPRCSRVVCLECLINIIRNYGQSEVVPCSDPSCGVYIVAPMFIEVLVDRIDVGKLYEIDARYDRTKKSMRKLANAEKAVVKKRMETVIRWVTEVLKILYVTEIRRDESRIHELVTLDSNWEVINEFADAYNWVQDTPEKMQKYEEYTKLFDVIINDGWQFFSWVFNGTEYNGDPEIVLVTYRTLHELYSRNTRHPSCYFDADPERDFGEAKNAFLSALKFYIEYIERYLRNPERTIPARISQFQAEPQEGDDFSYSCYKKLDAETECGGKVIDHMCEKCHLGICMLCNSELTLEQKEKRTHRCNVNDVKHVKAMIADTTQDRCPRCGIFIQKISGCYQMYCIKCRTAYAHGSGAIERGNIHNPHYFELGHNRDVVQADDLVRDFHYHVVQFINATREPSNKRGDVPDPEYDKIKMEIYKGRRYVETQIIEEGQQLPDSLGQKEYAAESRIVINAHYEYNMRHHMFRVYVNSRKEEVFRSLWVYVAREGVLALRTALQKLKIDITHFGDGNQREPRRVIDLIRKHYSNKLYSLCFAFGCFYELDTIHEHFNILLNTMRVDSETMKALKSYEVLNFEHEEDDDDGFDDYDDDDKEIIEEIKQAYEKQYRSIVPKEESEDEEPPKKFAVAGKKKVEETDSSDDDIPKKSAGKTANSKIVKRNVGKAESSDDDVPKKPVGKIIKGKTTKKNVEDAESSDDDVPKKRSAKSTKGNVEEMESSDDGLPVKKLQTKVAKKTNVETESQDDKIPKKPSAKSTRKTTPEIVGSDDDVPKKPSVKKIVSKDELAKKTPSRKLSTVSPDISDEERSAKTSKTPRLSTKKVVPVASEKESVKKLPTKKPSASTGDDTDDDVPKKSVPKKSAKSYTSSDDDVPKKTNRNRSPRPKSSRGTSPKGRSKK